MTGIQNYKSLSVNQKIGASLILSGIGPRLERIFIIFFKNENEKFEISKYPKKTFPRIAIISLNLNESDFDRILDFLYALRYKKFHKS